jgi:hypothetical protein
LKRSCSFPIAELPVPNFVMMASETATVPAGFFGKGTAGQQTVLLTYSYRGPGAGVVRVYETKSIKGVSAKDFLSKISDARVYRDVPHTNGWTAEPVIVGDVYVIPTSGSSAGVKAAVTSLKR